MRLISLITAAFCASAAPTLAGEVSISPKGDHFDLTVTVKETADDNKGTVIAKNETGSHVFSFNRDLFKDSAYAKRIFVLTWTPREKDRPAPDVQKFFVEIPVRLRVWLADNKYEIEAWSFDGADNLKLAEYEAIVKGPHWKKLLASLQQADHYANRALPQPPPAGARRALATAVAGLVTLANRADQPWIMTPLYLDDVILKSFSGFVEYERRRDALLADLRKVDGLIWRDLNGIEFKLRGLPCDVVRQTFIDLAQLRKDNEAGYVAHVGRDSLGLLENKRALAEKAVCNQ